MKIQKKETAIRNEKKFNLQVINADSSSYSSSKQESEVNTVVNIAQLSE